LSAATLVIFIIASLFGAPFFLRSFAPFLLFAISFLWVGRALIFNVRKEAGNIALVPGCVFLVWGIHKLNYPFIDHHAVFGTWRYAFGSVLAFLAALGIVMVHYEKMRRDLVASRAALQKSEQKYRIAIENQNELVAVVDRDGCFVFANPAFARFFIFPEQMADWPSLAAVLEEFRIDALPEAIASVENLPHQAYVEERALQKDGQAYWVAWSIRRIQQECLSEQDGSDRFCDNLLLVGRDCTELHHTQDQLRQSEKMQAIGQLAGGIAHDFNNQLSGILGYAEILGNRIGDPNMKRYATYIANAAERSSELISKLLTFSRKGTFVAAPVNLHSVVQEVIVLLEHSIDKRIHVKNYLEAENPWIIADASQIQNAILNLAINARDAMPDGGTITFSTRSIWVDEESSRCVSWELTPGEYIELDVADNGIGMDKQTQQHIFEPFFTTKEVGKGTGMGLAAVYGTVKMHRGLIHVYSELQKGTTFRLCFPLSEEYRQDGVDEVEKRNLDRYHGQDLILVIDDEQIFRDMAVSLLRQLGYSVLCASNGRDGIWQYGQHKDEIALVILDMIMPDYNGPYVFTRIREINSGARIMIASGFSLNGDAQRLLDQGACGFIQKPFRTNEFAIAVAAALHT